MNGTIQTSDARQKKEIQDSDLGLDFINDVYVPFLTIGNPGEDHSLHYGLIAQETEQALNEAKAKKGLGSESAIVDYDKTSDRYGLKYSELIAPLIKALQEISQKISSTESCQLQQQRELETRLQRLESENIELKKRTRTY